MHPEKRKDQRSIVTRQPKGKLQIAVGDQSYNVIAVHDASPTGIRLKTVFQISIGANILVRYLDQDVDLKVNGVVVWNSTSSEGDAHAAESTVFIIGIELVSPSLLKVFM
jgi:hypothetical protein